MQATLTQRLALLLTPLAATLLMASHADARDWYVSAKRGKGKSGTVEEPAGDIGNIASKLEPGDVVHIARGTYTGRSDSGSTTILVPVSVIGGYADDFKSRDPWGKHKTVLSGANPSKNYTADPTLFIDLMKYDGPNHPIVVDGVIVDMGDRNRYATDKEAKLVPNADPKTGLNPSPSLGALVVRVSKSEKFDRGPRWDITVRNNIVINAYGNQGALSVSGYKGSKIKIHNNLVAQHSGHGISLGSKYAGTDNLPEFDVAYNTVVFSWDSGFSQGFNLGMDSSVKANVHNNVFGFADFYAIWNGKKTKELTLVDNVITGARKGDFLEFDTVIAVEDLEDENEFLGDDTEGNVSGKIKLPVSKAFAELYGSRVVVDREKAEADVAATNSDANTLRSMLGLPVQAGSVKWPKIEVYLNRISVKDALKVAKKPQFKGDYGCSQSRIAK